VLESFDFVLIGGGTAGCLLASRLSEDASRSVLLLEAGPSSRSLWTTLPVGYFKTVFNKRLGWGYSTQPEPELHERRIAWPRGKLLGGTGAINGMVYIRGQAADYDSWAEQGNTGWSYEDVLPYFRKSETQVNGNEKLSERWHGQDGPMAISDYPDRHPLCQAFLSAASETGLPHNLDFNGADQFGSGYYQITASNGRRVDTATAFLRPVRHRQNLAVRCVARVKRLVIKDGRASAVVYTHRGEERTVKARCEIILAAGAVNSPQILQLSGIGDPQHLASVGIPVVKDLPGVGQNLQDHLQSQLVYRCREPISINDDLKSLWRKAKMVQRYLLHRAGPIAGGPAPAGAFAKSAEHLTRPDLQFHFLPLSLARPGVVDSFSGFSFNVCQSRPQSRGSIKISSGDPFAPPEIRANYLTHSHDQEVIVAGLKSGRRIAAAPAFERYLDREERPGKQVSTERELLEYARASASSIYHPVGTCKMGTGKEAVVDNKLQVHGIKGLRVVDASIMPTLPSGNTNAATVMIAEKAADLITRSQ